MKLSVMKNLVQTIDESWKSPVADKIADCWGADKGSTRYIRGSANFLFVFQREDERFILRFNEDSERKVEQIKAELFLLQLLKDKGLAVPEPVQSMNGQLVESVETDLGLYHASVFTIIKGTHPEFEALTDAEFTKWGETLGQLHQTLKECPETSDLNRPSWKDQLTFIRENLSPSETAAWLELDDLSQWAESLPVTNETYGLIHFDFELDNLLWNEDQVGIIDFDDSVYHWFVADIAFALRDMFENKLDLEHASFLSFMEGYRRMTDVDDKLIQELPQFTRMHKLYTFARLLRAVDLDEHQEHPDWLNGLIQKLQAKINAYRQGFVRVTN
ncbi:phosphotransferase enzyme family protein [Bacillus carboniphilus]